MYTVGKYSNNSHVRFNDIIKLSGKRCLIILGIDNFCWELFSCWDYTEAPEIGVGTIPCLCTPSKKIGLFNKAYSLYVFF